MKRRNLIVVDDFLDNPDGVRAYALEQNYERLGGKNWPGRDSVETHGEKEMTQACSEVVGQQLVIKPENKCSYFRITKRFMKSRLFFFEIIKFKFKNKILYLNW